MKNDTNGSVLIMVGVFVLVLFAIAGAAVDFGRAQLLQMKEQQATDSAALGAAIVLPKDTDHRNEMQIRNQAAQRFYNLNFPRTYLGVNRTMPTFNYDKAQGTVTVTKNNSITTNYTTTMGISDINVAARTKVSIPDKDLPDFDMVLLVSEFGKTVLVGSRNAIANGLLSSLFPSTEPTNPNLRFGLVGYISAISHSFSLTSDKDQAKSYLDSLTPHEAASGFYDHWGLEAASNLVSEPWNGYLPPAGFPSTSYAPEQNTGANPPETPRDDGKRSSEEKYIILLTNTILMNRVPPCPGGLPCPNYPLFLAQCDAIKAKGINIYIIGAYRTFSPTEEDTMRACATSINKYFYAPDDETLQNILTAIGRRIHSIRISD